MAINSLDLNFLKMALQIAEQDSGHVMHSKTNTVNRKKRGTVLAKGNQVVSTGISAHLGGNLYKPEVEDEKYIATINSEVVALGSAIRANVPLFDCTIYSTSAPNWITFKLLITFGIKRIVHYGPVPSERISHYAKELGIMVEGVGISTEAPAKS
jgi:deoxycytidylate deaminase